MIKCTFFAAGCFWGVQSAFDKVPGVLETTAGYMGGHTKNPTYKQVCGDKSGHAETVRVMYDTRQITLVELLDIFFMIHNPTTPDQQGPDRGTQYRSVLFYRTKSEQRLMEKKLKEYQSYFKEKIVTQILPAKQFYSAEDYHQKYYDKHGKKSCKNIEVNKESLLQKKLSPEQYWVMRGKGTEPPFSGAYLYTDDRGVYRCAACGQKLFDSSAKFQSGCGWPSFDASLPDSVIIRKDLSHFMIRDEVLCRRCGSHLGHVFSDGPTPTGLRYCINSVALNLKAK